MRRVLWLAGLSCSLAFGQFYDLTVTDDGSQVYFRTWLRLKSESPSRSGFAIYRWANGDLERLTTPGSAPEPYETDANPQISGDGSLFSYTHYQNCIGGSSCISRPTISASYLTIAGKPYEAVLQGEAQISRNGRFILSALLFGMTFPARTNVVVLRDVERGTSADVPVRPANRRQAVTGDGRVLAFSASGGLMLWSPQGAPALPVLDGVTSAIVNDAGTWVIYTRGYGTGEMRALEVASGRDFPLTGGDHPGYAPSISNDGSTVLYVSDRQAWLARPDGSGRKRLTDFAEGVDEAVVAGNGRVAVAATGGRIVAIDTASGATRELIGRTPLCGLGFTALTPGSLLPVRGSGMASTTEVATPPLPKRLGGISVTVDGAPLPLLSVSPGEIWFQVPFDLPAGPRATVEVEHSSIWNGCEARSVPVVDFAPYFFGQSGLTAAHADFSGLITAQSPARPGEVVTIWGVGLGAVTPAMETGVPTPIGQEFRLVKSFDCRVGYPPAGPPLEVSFAGLAPGLIGIYQVNVRMPDSAPSSGYLFLSCGAAGDEWRRHGGVVVISGTP